MSIQLLGGVGGVLAMLGVIACPITSGDTAFRSARLTIADWFKIDQKGHQKRLMLSSSLTPWWGMPISPSGLQHHLAVFLLVQARPWRCDGAVGGSHLCVPLCGQNYGWIAAVPAYL